MINKFSKIYAFLSNFHPSPIVVDGHEYPTVEHAYQAAKTLNRDISEDIRFASSAAEAKKLGRKIKDIRPDWDIAKLSIMKDLLSRKFAVGSPLAELLLDTKDEELIEGNWWGDTYWGVCNGKGENHLGKSLMERREYLKSVNPNKESV